MSNNPEIRKLKALLQAGKLSKQEYDKLVEIVRKKEKKEPIVVKVPTSPQPPESPTGPEDEGSFQISWIKVGIAALVLIGMVTAIFMLINSSASNENKELAEESLTTETIADSTTSEPFEPAPEEEHDFTEDPEPTIEEAPIEEPKVNPISEKESEKEIIKAPKEIQEFKDYYKKPDSERVDYFIEKVVNASHNGSLSSKEQTEYEAILKDAFNLFYEKRSSYTEGYIDENLSTFKSEFNMAGLTLDQAKTNELKALAGF